jgi:hypothetical protein
VPPGEWTDNSVLKIKITKLHNSTCFINTGGTQFQANNQTKCSEGFEFTYKYQEHIPDSLAYIVSTSILDATNAAEANKTGAPLDSVGMIEFEYWAENAVPYEDLTWYITAAGAAFGTLFCCCLSAILYSSFGETLEDSNVGMWKLKDKDRVYLEENAPSVLKMAAEGEKSAVKVGDFKPLETSNLSKQEKIRNLKNELQDAWCCNEGLASIESPCLAIFCLIINLFLPGFGTIFSACCAQEPIKP